MRAFRTALAAGLPAAMLLVLAGCGPLPQPFAKPGADMARARLLIAPASEGVAVRPITGVDDETADLLAAMTVRALRERGVAASAHTANRASLILSSAGRRLPDGALEIAWRLRRANGVVIGERVDAIATDDRFAQSIASVAAWVLPAPATQPAEPARSLAGTSVPETAITVTMFGVGGAAGNGNALLARALAQALSRAGVAVTGDLAVDGHAIQGAVDVERLENGLDRVSVAWVVLDAQGRELGVVNQRNTVPPGSLDRDWGPVAAPIAGTAVDGVLAVIARAKRSQAAR